MAKILLFALLIGLLGISVFFASSASFSYGTEETSNRVTTDSGESGQRTGDSDSDLDDANTSQDDPPTADVSSADRREEERDLGRDADNDSEDETPKQVRNRTTDAPNNVRAVAERLRSQCETTDDETLRRLCNTDVEALQKFNCDERYDDNEADEKALCEHKANAYGKRYLVSYRHLLSASCRELTGDNRSACEQRVNTLFREELVSSFKDWVSGQMQLSEADLELAKERLQELREKLKEEYGEQNRTRGQSMNASEQRLLGLFDNLLNKTENFNTLMERAISKAGEKGHDTTELQFLLEQFNAALDNARTYVGELQYRDALASLKEAKEILHEFRKVFAKVVQENKEGRVHAVDVDSAFTDD